MTGAVVVLGFAAACTSVSGLTTDEASDAGGPDSATVADAAVDVAYDTSKTEDPEAAAPTYCQTLPGMHSFCDDFDDGTFGANWSGKTQIGGTVGRVAGGVSAPWAYGAIAEVTATSLHLQKEFAQTVKTVICELDIRVAQFGVPQTRVMKLAFASSQTSQYYLEIELSTSKADISEYKEYAGGGVTVTGKPLPVPAVGAWKHLKLNAVLKPSPIGGGNPRATVIIDGKEEAVVDVQPPTVDITRVMLELGIDNGINGTKSDWKMHFDNVVCDVQ